MNEGFLDAIREQPEDDTLRLIYADFLEDQGDDDRAEFVRLQVRLRRMRPSDPQWAALDARSRELTAVNGGRWVGERPASLKEWSFRGGLVDRLVFQHDAVLADVEPLLLRHPGSHLVLGSVALLPPLARCAALGQVRGLTINCPLAHGGRILDSLFDSPNLRGLHVLSLRGEGIDNHLVRALVQSPGLRELRTLRLHGTSLSDAGVVQLLRPEVLPGLQEWDVHGRNVSGVALGWLFTPHRALKWRGLAYQELHSYRAINFNRFSPQALLDRCTNLRRLSVHLSLFGLEATEKRMGWLPALKQLRELHLAGAVDDDAALKELTTWRGLGQLDCLRLSVPPSRREAIRHKLEASAFRNPATVVTFLS
jgi:uncharacterized protein (TIGR02996 family)